MAALAALLMAAPCAIAQDINRDPGLSQSALDVIFSRKSVRTYTDKAVSEEQVETLLKAAMAAPTGNDKPKDKWKPENIHYDKW